MATHHPETFEVEIIEVGPKGTRRMKVLVLPHTTIDAILDELSVQRCFSDLTLKQMKLGCFGQVLTLTHEIKPGERIELLHPLIICPKEARRVRGLRSNLVPRSIRGRGQNK